MRFLALLAVGAACFGFGWFARESTYDPPVEREARKDRPETTPDYDRVSREEAALEQARAERAQARKDAGVSDEPFSGPAGDTPPAEAGDEPFAAPDGDAEPDPVREMMKTQGPQWKAWATMQAKPKIQAMLAALGFDAETTKRIEALMIQDVENQMDRAMAMMLGDEEMNPDTFMYFLGVPPDLAPEVERELGTFLNDNEIASLRSEVKKAHDQQLTDIADMQINMMAVPNLAPDQKTRLREVFRGKNMMQEQFTQFAEVTRDRELLRKLAAGEIDLAKEIEKSMEPQRLRVQEILTPEQMESYKRYQETMIKQAEMGMKMFGSVLKTEPKTEKKQ